MDRIAAELQQHLLKVQKEREAFWAFADEDSRAEWIHGKAVLHSPVKGRHFIVSSNLTYELQKFIREEGGNGIIPYETTVVACGRHDFMPDIVFWREERRSEIDLEARVLPTPDFVIEILSKSTEKLDRGLKMEAYAEAGVQEYWLVDPRNLAIETYYLGGDAAFVLGTVYRTLSCDCRFRAARPKGICRVRFVAHAACTSPPSSPTYGATSYQLGHVARHCHWPL